MRLVVRLVIGLLLLVVLAIGLVWIFQDSVVKTAIQSGGSWATGVETRVDDVSAALVGGKLDLSGLSLANPVGFSAEPCFSLRSAKADWETRSLLSDEIHLREIVLDGLALRIERNVSGTNFSQIIAHRPKDESKPTTKESGAKRTLVVDSIVLNDVSAELVLADMPLAKGPLRVTVPRIEIKDFRSDGSTQELVGQLLSAIVQAALDSSLAAGAGIFPEDLARDLRGKLDNVLQDRLGTSVDEAGKALEGLKDIFGGKKDKKE